MQRQCLDSTNPNQWLLTQRRVQVRRCGVQGETHHGRLPQNCRIMNASRHISKLPHNWDNGGTRSLFLIHKYTSTRQNAQISRQMLDRNSIYLHLLATVVPHLESAVVVRAATAVEPL